MLVESCAGEPKEEHDTLAVEIAAGELIQTNRLVSDRYLKINIDMLLYSK